MSSTPKPTKISDAELIQLFHQRLSRILSTNFAKEVESGKFNAVDLIVFDDGTTGLNFASTNPDLLDAFILHYRKITILRRFRTWRLSLNEIRRP